MEPRSWHRQPSRSRTRVLTIAYFFGSSFSRGRFWRRRVEFIELCINKPLAEARSGWPPPENQRKSSLAAGNSGSRFGGSGYRCTKQNEPLRSGQSLPPQGPRTLVLL